MLRLDIKRSRRAGKLGYNAHTVMGNLSLFYAAWEWKTGHRVSVADRVAGEAAARSLCEKYELSWEPRVKLEVEAKEAAVEMDGGKAAGAIEEQIAAA